ncbi:uncharacterized protein JCM6883_005125 [Sporobolomyces salmoneus]|uniref:uncharacterized protein n=1 Tax=Sporobolomyces salmoneus TaxID=183962 RepID=UPI00316E4077
MYRQYLEELWSGLSGNEGTIGWYSSLQRCFIAFGILSPLCFFIDAPFGRFASKSKWLTINGSFGWWIMEIVSPLAFLSSLPLGQHATNFPSFSPSRIYHTFLSLPLRRQTLVVLFLVHYFNRSTLSTLQNPSRARMNLLVPISAIVFNLMNGSLMGSYIGGGHFIERGGTKDSGLKEGKIYQALFNLGIIMWTIGFVSNIYHDQILYQLKRDKLRQPRENQNSTDPKTRYSIPPKVGLYRYVSHPSYSSEWFEWFGYLLSTFALSSSPFPPQAFHFSSISTTTTPLTPLTEWYLTPSALFLWQEIGVMLPRARSGHKWYERTFGTKEWKEKGQKWIVIPGVY